MRGHCSWVAGDRIADFELLGIQAGVIDLEGLAVRALRGPNDSEHGDAGRQIQQVGFGWCRHASRDRFVPN
jgi:hypothetical protein